MSLNSTTSAPVRGDLAAMQVGAAANPSDRSRADRASGSTSDFADVLDAEVETRRSEARRSETRRSDAQRFEAQRSDTQRSDTQRSDAEHRDTRPIDAQRTEPWVAAGTVAVDLAAAEPDETTPLSDTDTGTGATPTGPGLPSAGDPATSRSTEGGTAEPVFLLETARQQVTPPSATQAAPTVALAHVGAATGATAAQSDSAPAVAAQPASTPASGAKPAGSSLASGPSAAGPSAAAPVAAASVAAASVTAASQMDPTAAVGGEAVADGPGAVAQRGGTAGDAGKRENTEQEPGARTSAAQRADGTGRAVDPASPTPTLVAATAASLPTSAAASSATIDAAAAVARLSESATAPLPITAPVTATTAGSPSAVAPTAPLPSQLPDRPVAAQLTGPIASLRTAGAGEHVMVIRVSPDSIGPVRVLAHIGAAGVQIELLGGSDAAREALRAALPDLRRDLAGAGLTANLSLGPNGSTGGPTGQDQFGAGAGLGGRYGSASQGESGTHTRSTDARGPMRAGADTAPPPDPVGRTGPRRLDVTV